MDLSCFMHRGSTVPRGIYSFFDVEDLEPGGHIDITLEYEGKNYRAYLARESVNNRIRIFWHSELSDVINTIYDYDEVEDSQDFPYMSFTKKSPTLYKLTFTRVPSRELLRRDSEELDAVYEGELALERKMEGTRKERYSVYYERNPSNRESAIRIHGLRCMVCGFDFEKVYGERGRGYIEVHHNKPLFNLDEPMLVDPETDLDCVCSNCHRMIHRFRDRVLTVDELRNLMNAESHQGPDTRHLQDNPDANC